MALYPVVFKLFWLRDGQTRLSIEFSVLSYQVQTTCLKFFECLTDDEHMMSVFGAKKWILELTSFAWQLEMNYSKFFM